MIKEIFHYKGDISFDTTKPDGTPRNLLDINKITKLGWKPKYALREGLEITYNWSKENYPMVKGCSKN